MIAGKGSVAAFQFALLSIPSMYLGTWLGRRARNAVSEQAFQRLTYVLLLTTAVSTALASFI
jgi:uncharacterized membrane protein YfcA